MIKGILILLLLSLNLFSQYPIKVEVEKEDKYIMGVDSIYVKIKLKNISGKQLELKGGPSDHWYLGGKECNRGAYPGPSIFLPPADEVIDKSGGADKRIAKDWEKEEIHNIFWPSFNSNCRLEKEGVYNFYYVYRDNLGERDLTERVNVEINYVMPEGIDREAYEYFKGYPLARPEELLEKYPTSTYAGWVMFSPGADLEYKGGYELIEDMLKPVNERKRWGTLVEKCEGKNYPKTKTGRYCIKSAEEEAKEYIRFAEAFLPLHNDHPNAGIIYARLFLAYMVVHRWEEAYEAGKKSLELPWAKWLYSLYPPKLEEEKKVLKEAMENLIRRGLVKNKR